MGGLARLAISVLSGTVLLYFVSFSEFLGYLQKTDPGWFIAAMFVNVLVQPVSALRFKYVAEALGGKLAFGRLLRIHFIGMWFNQVLPTGLGGDVVKISMLKKNLGLGLAVRTTILDRFSGLAFVIFAIAVLVGEFQDLTGNTPLALSLVSASAMFFLATVVFASMAEWFRRAWEHRKWRVQAIVILADIRRFFRGKALYRQFWTSLAVHINGIIAYAFLGNALGLEIGVMAYVLLVPLVFLVALLPISFAGWGIREAGAISVFGLIGIAAEEALALSVLFGILMIASSLPGLVAMNIDTGRARNP